METAGEKKRMMMKVSIGTGKRREKKYKLVKNGKNKEGDLRIIMIIMKETNNDEKKA